MIGKTSVEGSKGVLSASAFHAATTTAKAATRRTIVLVTLATSADTSESTETMLNELLNRKPMIDRNIVTQFDLLCTINSPDGWKSFSCVGLGFQKPSPTQGQ